MIEDVKSFSRRDNSRWKSMELAWSYVHQLDRLLTRLAFVRREAKAIGVSEVAGEVIDGALAPTTSHDLRTDRPQTRRTAQMLFHCTIDRTDAVEMRRARRCLSKWGVLRADGRHAGGEASGAVWESVPFYRSLGI